MPYEEWLPSILPPWLNTNGRAFARGVGARMDKIVQLYRDAVLSRFPKFAPEDALGYIGKERGLPRGPAESASAYALRLAAAWTAWQGDQTPVTGKGGGGGTPLGLLNAIKAAGLPTGSTGATIVTTNGTGNTGSYFQLDGSGNLVKGDLMANVNRSNLTGAIPGTLEGWTFRHDTDHFWSIFGIVFPADVPTLRAGTADASRLNAAAEQWRQGNELYVGAWVIESGRLLGWPAGRRTSGTEPVLGGNVRHFIPPANGEHTQIGYSA